MPFCEYLMLNQVEHDSLCFGRAGIFLPLAQLVPGLLRESKITRPKSVQLILFKLLEVKKRIVRALGRPEQFVELYLDCLSVAVLCVLRNTIRNVTIVVAVFMTSCHVSLKLKIGPVINHTAMRPTAREKMIGRPAMCAVHLVKREYHALRLI